MVIAMTGVSGFVGRVVAPLLVAQGHRVRGLVRAGGVLPAGARPGESGAAAAVPGVELVVGDLLRAESLAELVRGVDVVIHLAASITVSDTFDEAAYRVNTEGTRLLLDAARAAGVRRFVHVSSVVVFSQAPYDEPLYEGRGYAAESAYDYERSKLAAHLLALSYNGPGFEVIALAPTAVIGPYDSRPSRIGETVVKIYRGRVPAIFSGGIDFVDVRDVASAIVSALTLGSPGRTYLLAGGWHSLASLRDVIASVAGRRIWLPVLPVWLVRAAVLFVRVITQGTGWFRYFNRAAIDKVLYSNRHVDPARARAELGFTSRPFAETVSDTIEWFRDQGIIL